MSRGFLSFLFFSFFPSFFLSFFLSSFFFFFFAFHFLKPLKFVWVYQNGNFYRQKALHAGKIGKSNSPPPKDIPVTPPCKRYDRGNRSEVILHAISLKNTHCKKLQRILQCFTVKLYSERLFSQFTVNCC